MGCSFFLASLIYVLIENGYLAFVAGVVFGLTAFLLIKENSNKKKVNFNYFL